MLSALLPTPGFAQNWTLPVSKLKHVCSLVFVRFRLQTSASNSEQIDVGQMSQKIHAPVAMDLQQNRSTDRNCPFSFQPYFAPTSQITFSTTSKESQLCFANKLANFCRCLMFFFAGPAVWTNHLQVRFAEMPLPAHFAVELLQFWFKQHACPLSCGCSLFRNEGARDFHSDSELK